MSAPPADGSTGPPISGVCGLCGDRLGVYEPVVREHPAQAEPTSLAADPTLSDAGGAMLFHASCYAQRAANPLGSA